jgi:hypothetical protein
MCVCVYCFETDFDTQIDTRAQILHKKSSK